MELYRQYQTNKQLEKEGFLLELGTTQDGKIVAIRIARAGGANVAFSKLVEHKLKPYRRQIQHETADKEVIDRLMKEVYAKTVILGWENVNGKDGQPLEFTEANVVQLLEDLPDLWKDIVGMSDKTAAFREEIREADTGN